MYSVIGADGKTYGPVDANTLKTWCREGRVTADTQVIDAVTDNRTRAADVIELADVFTPQSPLPGYAPNPHATQSAQPGRTTSQPYPGGNPYDHPGTGVGGQPGMYSGYNRTGSSPYANLAGPHYMPQPLVGKRSKVTAALLAFFLGFLGIHRFYLGYTTIGVVQILLFWTGISGIWALVDMLLILTGNLDDADGYALA